MIWQALVGCVLVLHLSFIVFVMVGGFLAIRWRWLSWVHLPAAVWGTALECRGWICPLTYLENWLRHINGTTGYSGGFIEYYLIPIVYPLGLTPEIQIQVGLGVL